jgi:broad specificity phosphatase PhoE
MWERCSRERDFVPALGCSSVEAARRLARFVSQLAVGPVAAVTHGGVLADYLRNVFAVEELESVSAAFARGPYDGRVVRECSITTVRAGARLELVSIAAADHLT